MKTYAPDNLQAMTSDELDAAITCAEVNLERAQDYVEYLESCSPIRRNQLMPDNLRKVDAWQRNLEVARREQAERLAS